MELNIKITEEQTQRLLMFLGEFPYKEVADLIDTVKSQANEQLTENLK